MISQWRNLDREWAAVALLLTPVNIFLQFWKWHLLLRCAQPQCPAGMAWYSLFAGFPLGLLTPGRWGELARAIYVPALPQEEVFALSAFDKIHTLLVNALLGSGALIYLIARKMLAEKWLGVAALAFAAFLFLNLCLVIPAWLRGVAGLPRRFGVKKFANCSAAWLLPARKLGAIYLLSLLFVATYCVQMSVVVRGLVSIDLTPAIAGAAAIFFLKSALPITIGELGVREGVAIFILQGMQVPALAAANASLMLFALNLVLPAFIGLLWTWKRKHDEQAA